MVTVPFDTVTELIAPFWIISNKNKIKPLPICITSSFVGSANRHGSPRSLSPFSGGLFIITQPQDTVN
jgi:hypothetical protein